MPTTKRRALILISSARQLPLVEPADVKSISTGFFLVEMAQVLKEFEDDYEFTFATPDGNVPQLDINGMGLAMHAIEKIGYKTLPLTMQQRRGSFDVSSFRQRHPGAGRPPRAGSPTATAAHQQQAVEQVILEVHYNRRITS